MEFLLGRLLGNNLLNLGLYDTARALLPDLGTRLEDVLECEPDAALGNGGLGRLAACFLDSLATLDMPGFGYGINYEFGLFKQAIEGGCQQEKPDHWLAQDSPWEIERYDEACLIPVYGQVIPGADRRGQHNPMWMDWRLIIGIPYDLPIVGYGGRTVNKLRLFSARSSSEFDIKIFNEGDYLRAVEQKISSETVSKVLYPSDQMAAGRELRLLQEYFLVACAVRDIVRKHRSRGHSLLDLPDFAAIQMNDTHPSLAVAELMRMLVDEGEIGWDPAWEITRRVCAYTNHTLMPEALEKWPVELLRRVIPRHLEIIFEINRRFLEDVSGKWPASVDRLRRMSLIEEGAEQQVRMAHLAIVGSHSINGVAALHSELVRKSLVPDFFDMYPERFNNKTNGVTPRRWLQHANPEMARLITEAIGDGWQSDLVRLRELETRLDDPGFRREFREVKQSNKRKLASLAFETTGIRLNPDSLFDVQAKRIHEYKRQLLNVLGIIHTYLSIKEDGILPPTAVTFVFAGKAAPGYLAAKQIIKLIHSVADVVNSDSQASQYLTVVFLPDYRVSLAERLIPAADLSEQISTAGTEASGTGNMKFAMNGALTIGTLDGANIEIMAEVGRENMYVFGLTPDGVRERLAGNYSPSQDYQRSAAIRRVIDSLSSDFFSRTEAGSFGSIVEKLLSRGDQYLHLADFASYVETRNRAYGDFKNRDDWDRRAILNVARMGHFSSDRTVREYAAEIWGISSIK